MTQKLSNTVFVTFRLKYLGKKEKDLLFDQYVFNLFLLSNHFSLVQSMMDREPVPGTHAQDFTGPNLCTKQKPVHNLD